MATKTPTRNRSKKPATKAKKPATKAKKPATKAKKPATKAKKPATKAKKPAAKAKPAPRARKAAGGKKKPTARKPVRRNPAPRKNPTGQATPGPRPRRHGFISHTELASATPEATVEWARNVLEWKFLDPMPTPVGPYYMWTFGDEMGGGIRAIAPMESGGTVPYCEVSDIRQSFERAVSAGATQMMPPTEITGGYGWIAVVSAPGGVPIGLWAPR